jgi:hypothetical protein
MSESKYNYEMELKTGFEGANWIHLPQHKPEARCVSLQVTQNSGYLTKTHVGTYRGEESCMQGFSGET